MGNQKSATSGLQKIVAENVKARRLRLGLSQEELADICGYHRTYIGSIERAERNITLSTLEAVAQALDVSPQELVQGNDG
jgi:transcriptional regulator with XRE-family HTH domain